MGERKEGFIPFEDMVDISAIPETYPKGDFQRIRRRLNEFAKILENPEIIRQAGKVIKRFRK